ncbi:hypothetical protein F0562_007913 [Nyssa sinensis]|uniref:PGG domain-containing protein n=1 Tax=Nyssa sinensis TaxID=561372 RepID=A0A5J5A9A9_9ASTE|nr:hypothetical protein F0562_007913 [Nyssa sinensis]
MEGCCSSGRYQHLVCINSGGSDLLENIDKIPFVDTPLHIAASVGQTHFAIEVMRLKPSFGRKLNPDGFSPMHLALQNYTLRSQPILADTVRKLVKFDSELVRVRGKEGITPLHYVAQTGEDDVLADFLWACPASMEELTNRCETATHIAVKNKHVQAFKVILGWLNRTKKEEVLNWKDENGNTVLHIAASTNQEEVVKLLVKEVLKKMPGIQWVTALDVALQSETPVDESIIDILRHAKVKLKDAAQVGDINMSYAFIQEYPNLLEDIDKKPFVDTPLHIAASAGCTRFAIEVLRLKPSFGRKLNQDGFSPMHLALQQNQNETQKI